ncbi:MAG: VWA domain-containing protein [Polyangiales bacterium]
MNHQTSRRFAVLFASGLACLGACKGSVVSRINRGNSQISSLEEGEHSTTATATPTAPPSLQHAPTVADPAPAERAARMRATGGGGDGRFNTAAPAPAARPSRGAMQGDSAHGLGGLPAFQPSAAPPTTAMRIPAPQGFGDDQRGPRRAPFIEPRSPSPPSTPTDASPPRIAPAAGTSRVASLARAPPRESRELVGDVGSRYAPEMPAPTTQALAWRVDLERTALAPSGGPTHLRIALRSSATAATARPPMSVHVVLDVSNSMAGPSIENARRAAQDLVSRLEPTDHFSLVAFGATASVRVPEGLVGPRRQQILDTIAGLQLEGGTNISGGLELGYAEAARGPQAPEWVKLVMLLSDGRPNAGETDAEAIGAMAGRAFQTGVQTSSFGVGDDYDGNLMSGVAQQGAGGYYYVRDSQGIAQALATELESRLQPVAQAVEIRVRLRPDVRLTQTYGSRRLDVNEAAQVRAQEVAVDDQTARRDRIARDRQSDAEGGMRFFIPGFARDDQHVILLGLEVPAGVGARPIATVEHRYKDRLTRRNVTDESPVRARYADSDAASVATADPSVLRTVQGFDAGETLVRAARLVGSGGTAEASALLNERASLLRAASAALHEPRLAADASRVDRLRNLLGGTGGMSEPLALALLLNTSGQGMLH